jgi:hypothetical protein
MRSVSMGRVISASCSQNRRSPGRNGLENGFPLRGTEGSNPVPSSGESGANLSLAGIRLPTSRSRGFPRVCGPGRAARSADRVLKTRRNAGARKHLPRVKPEEEIQGGRTWLARDAHRRMAANGATLSPGRIPVKDRSPSKAAVAGSPVTNRRSEPVSVVAAAPC